MVKRINIFETCKNL